MKHRYPKFAVLIVLAFMPGLLWLCDSVLSYSGGRDGLLVPVMLWVLPVVVGGATVLGALYMVRYSVDVTPEGVSITGAFRTHIIPLDAIAQVVTLTASRSGTSSLLLDKDDHCLAKFDAGLTGFQVLLLELSEALTPYHTAFYRNDFLYWEKQVAGESRWTPDGPPRFARKRGRRTAFWGILAVGAGAAVVWLAH